MTDTGGFDPFADRLTQPNSITDFQTLIHLTKAAIGTGILSMPIAFMYSGLFFGIFNTFLTTLICGHCAYILVKCAHILYYKEKRTKMMFGEVCEIAMLNGPKCTQKFASALKNFLNFILFLCYFGTLCVYTVIIAKNFRQVLEHYTKKTYSDRLIMALFFIPLVLLAYIPNLKKLAPLSMFANALLALCILITCIYCVIDLPPITDAKYVRFDELPNFFAICIFAMECIGMIMPLENNMQTPTHFLGVCGVMAWGMIVMAALSSALGFLGYWRYLDGTAESITLNLPSDEWPAQIVKLIISLTVFCTFGLQFTVALEIAWNVVEHSFQDRPMLGNYIVRTILVTAAVGIAILVPSIAPFMGLIGAFAFSICGLLIPVIIETVMCLDIGFGPCLWILWKNIAIFSFGIFALIFGSHAALKDIAKLYD